MYCVVKSRRCVLEVELVPFLKLSRISPDFSPELSRPVRNTKRGRKKWCVPDPNPSNIPTPNSFPSYSYRADMDPREDPKRYIVEKAA